MNKKTSRFIHISCFLSAFAMVFATSFTVTSALVTKAANNTSFSIGQAANRTVTLYTDHNGSSWSTHTTINVAAGATVSTATSPTKSGYTFQGWVTSAPTKSTGTAATDFPVEYTTDQLNALKPASNMTLYPVFKSSTPKVYTHSNDADYYYEVNTDVTVSYKTISSVFIGDRYLGVPGVMDETSSWNDSRDLVTNSGVYKFYDDGGGVRISRKIGLKVTDTASDYWNSNNQEYYSVYGFNNNDDNGWSGVVTRNNSKASPYSANFYIDYHFAKIIFVRHSSDADGWGNKWNQSGDIVLTGGYTSTNYINSKNKDWWDTWEGTWVAS